MKTKVIFRKWRDNGDIIAIFPELPGNNQPYSCLSYQHIGQHGSCSVDLIPWTSPATKEEYTPLLKELESIGYNLAIRRRVDHRTAFDARLKAIRDIKGE